MKSIIISFLFLNFSTALFAQSLKTEIAKPSIDTSVFGRWPSAGLPIISNDGSYAFYTIRHQPADGSTLVIRSLKNAWKKQIINASNASFTTDSRKVIFVSPRKTLCTLALGSDGIDSVANTSSYRLIKQAGEEWLVYQLNNPTQELKVVNLKTNLEKSFTGVISYLFSSYGNVLALLKQSAIDNKSQSIDWVNFPSGDVRNIWNGNSARNLIFDKAGNQLAFVVEASKDGKTEKSIFHFRAGGEKAELLADNNIKGIDSNLVIEGISGGFSIDGEKLFISLKEKEHPKPKQDAVMVDVWSYQDVMLQSMQLLELSQSPSYTTAIGIKDHQVVRLQQEGDHHTTIVEQWPNKVYISHYSGDLLEMHWNAAARQSYYLVSTADNGERQELPLEPAPFSAVSPNGKYIVGKVTNDKNNFYCYNVSTGKIQNITHSILAPYDKELDDKVPGYSKWLEMGNWLDNEKGVVLFDRYDMWLVDPDGIKSPVNLTNGYGAKNKIFFRLPEVYRHNKSLVHNNKIYLKGFSRVNKTDGLYTVEVGKESKLQLLTAGPYQYEIPDNSFNSAQLVLSSQRFVVRRESATQSPDYFLTSDFKTFTPVTDVYPEKSFNWLTSELHTWESPNGEALQGILYKPQNFDPKKKYPVIFHYYERLSDGLNKYLEPEAITDNVNIPWFVSNGYLVFTPDIHYEIGKIGESALNAVVSAARYLAKFPWVDARRLGLQGHSFGGYETNYIVSHSNLFSAAMSSSGYSDLISIYGSLGFGGRSAQGYFERGQGRMEATLWDKPGIYIKETTIFNALYVNTPLLMMANKKDELSFSQQLELFLSLRRLGKRVWMLQYDEGDHTLDLSKDALLHTIRITQFFDHYLKGSLPPRWMTRGILTSRKGIDDGLELDKEIKTPGEGLLKPEEKKKVEALRTRNQ